MFLLYSRLFLILFFGQSLHGMNATLQAPETPREKVRTMLTNNGRAKDLKNNHPHQRPALPTIKIPHNSALNPYAKEFTPLKTIVPPKNIVINSFQNLDYALFLMQRHSQYNDQEGALEIFDKNIRPTMPYDLGIAPEKYRPYYKQCLTEVTTMANAGNSKAEEILQEQSLYAINETNSQKEQIKRAHKFLTTTDNKYLSATMLEKIQEELNNRSNNGTINAFLKTVLYKHTRKNIDPHDNTIQIACNFLANTTDEKPFMACLTTEESPCAALKKLSEITLLPKIIEKLQATESNELLAFIYSTQGQHALADTYYTRSIHNGSTINKETKKNAALARIAAVETLSEQDINYIFTLTPMLSIYPETFVCQENPAMAYKMGTILVESLKNRPQDEHIQEYETSMNNALWHINYAINNSKQLAPDQLQHSYDVKHELHTHYMQLYKTKNDIPAALEQYLLALSLRAQKTGNFEHKNIVDALAQAQQSDSSSYTAHAQPLLQILQYIVDSTDISAQEINNQDSSFANSKICSLLLPYIEQKNTACSNNSEMQHLLAKLYYEKQEYGLANELYTKINSYNTNVCPQKLHDNAALARFKAVVTLSAEDSKYIFEHSPQIYNSIAAMNHNNPAAQLKAAILLTQSLAHINNNVQKQQLVTQKALDNLNDAIQSKCLDATQLTHGYELQKQLYIRCAELHEKNNDMPAALDQYHRAMIANTNKKSDTDYQKIVDAIAQTKTDSPTFYNQQAQIIIPILKTIIDPDRAIAIDTNNALFTEFAQSQLCSALLPALEHANTTINPQTPRLTHFVGSLYYAHNNWDKAYNHFKQLNKHDQTTLCMMLHAGIQHYSTNTLQTTDTEYMRTIVNKLKPEMFNDNSKKYIKNLLEPYKNYTMNNHDPVVAQTLVTKLLESKKTYSTAIDLLEAMLNSFAKNVSIDKDTEDALIQAHNFLLESNLYDRLVYKTGNLSTADQSKTLGNIFCNKMNQESTLQNKLHAAKEAIVYYEDALKKTENLPLHTTKKEVLETKLGALYFEMSECYSNAPTNSQTEIIQNLSKAHSYGNSSASTTLYFHKLLNAANPKTLIKTFKKYEKIIEKNSTNNTSPNVTNGTHCAFLAAVYSPDSNYAANATIDQLRKYIQPSMEKLMFYLEKAAQNNNEFALLTLAHIHSNEEEPNSTLKNSHFDPHASIACCKQLMLLNGGVYEEGNVLLGKAYCALNKIDKTERHCIAALHNGTNSKDTDAALLWRIGIVNLLKNTVEGTKAASNHLVAVVEKLKIFNRAENWRFFNYIAKKDMTTLAHHYDTLIAQKNTSEEAMQWYYLALSMPQISNNIDQSFVTFIENEADNGSIKAQFALLTAPSTTITPQKLFEYGHSILSSPSHEYFTAITDTLILCSKQIPGIALTKDYVLYNHYKNNPENLKSFLTSMETINLKYIYLPNEILTKIVSSDHALLQQYADAYVKNPSNTCLAERNAAMLLASIKSNSNDTKEYHKALHYLEEIKNHSPRTDTTYTEAQLLIANLYIQLADKTDNMFLKQSYLKKEATLDCRTVDNAYKLAEIWIEAHNGKNAFELIIDENEFLAALSLSIKNTNNTRSKALYAEYQKIKKSKK